MGFFFFFFFPSSLEQLKPRKVWKLCELCGFPFFDGCVGEAIFAHLSFRLNPDRCELVAEIIKCT